MLTETPSRTGEPNSLLGPLAEVYRALVHYVARVRVALWAWDSAVAQQLIAEAYAEHGEIIEQARLVARRYDLREEETEATSASEDPGTGRLQVPPKVEPRDVPLYVLSGPASVLDFVRRRISRETPPPPNDISDAFRYRFVDRPDGASDMRGYSWSGDSFNPDVFQSQLARTLVGPGVTIALNTDEEKTISEFSTSIRVLVSRADERRADQNPLPLGFVDIAIQGDLIQVAYTTLDPLADPTPTFELIAAAAAAALPEPA